MKRTPLTRKSPLRGTPKPCCGKSLCTCGEAPSLKRSRLNPVNRERKRKRFQEDFGGKEYLEFIHSRECCVCGVSGWTVAAHVRSRGAGGKASDIVPLCGSRLGVVGCHELLDTAPWELPEGTVGRLRALAKRLWSEWERREE